jgi:hypothetical protein
VRKACCQAGREGSVRCERIEAGLTRGGGDGEFWVLGTFGWSGEWGLTLVGMGMGGYGREGGVLVGVEKVVGMEVRSVM